MRASIKSTKRAPLVIAAVIVLALAISGAAYAWFAASAGDIGTAGGEAARIRLGEPHPVAQENFKFASALPGEEITIDGPIVWYDGTRDAIIRIGLGDFEAGFGTEAIPGSTSSEIIEWEFKFGGSYTKDGVVYKYTKQRMNEILEIMLVEDDIHFDKWHKGSHTGDWYIWAKWDELDSTYNIAKAFKIKFTGEFGGDFDPKLPGHPATNVEKDPVTGLTLSRQWEQESVFYYIGLAARAIQVTEEAIADHWGTDALQDVLELDAAPGKGGFTMQREEWKYSGD